MSHYHAARKVVPNYNGMGPVIQSWTLNHPIAGDFMFRDSTAPEPAGIIVDQAVIEE